MNKKHEIAHFKVAPQLAVLLGETYRSSEYALKELIDNAWDADAKKVKIYIPDELLSSENIFIEDNGYGMTKIEVENEYLNIAQNKIIKRGNKTPKDRKIKGRKGIGKFAGLVTSNVMQVETWSKEEYSNLIINKKQILNSQNDIEKIPLSIYSEPCNKEKQGTKITLTGLNQNLNAPSVEVMKQILFAEYGRDYDMTIFINGKQLTIEEAKPDLTIIDTSLDKAGSVNFKIGISNSKIPVRQAGIQLKVSGKIVGKPSFFGLEDCDDIPQKQLKRIYGEIEVDDLEDFVLGNWSGIIENSKAFQEVKSFVQEEGRKLIEENYPKEYNLSLARLQKKYYKTIELLPEYKQGFAKKSLENILSKYFGDNDRIDAIISVMIDALQKDEYWVVVEKMENADTADIEILANVLNEFGLIEVALISKQANSRKKFIDSFEQLVRNPKTSEQDIHKVIEKSLWLINNHLVLYKSNTSVKKIVEDNSDKKYKGDRAYKRPDLILINNYSNEYVLIELKKYDYTLKIRDATQAVEYAIDLRPRYGEMRQIIVIGGKMPKHVNKDDFPKNVQLESYDRLIMKARNEINWLIDEFTDIRNLR